MNFKEAIETPPHMPRQFYEEYKKAFAHVLKLLQNVSEIKGFYKFAKDFIGSTQGNYIDAIVNDVPRWIVQRVESISQYIEWAFKVDDDVQEVSKWLKKTLDTQLLKELDEIEFTEIESSIAKLAWEVEDAKDNWDEQEWGKYYTRVGELGEIDRLLRSLKKMKVWYKEYFDKTKAHTDTITRKVTAYYSGRNPDKSKPETGQTETLYHATTAVSSILKEGFKTRKELGGRGGLGGGPNDVISFTSDLKIAEAIVYALRRAYEVSSGKMSFAQLEKLGRKLGDFEQAMKSVEANWGRKDFITRTQSVPFKVTTTPRTDEEKRDWMFRAWSATLLFQSKIYNPWFAFVTYKDFENLNPNDIGIVAAEVEMDKVGEYLASMEEYRVPVNAVKRVWRVPYRGVFNPLGY